MTRKMILKSVAVLGVALLAAQAFAGEALVLKAQTDRESYSNGVNIARNLRQQGGEVNLDVLIQGMKDELTGEKLLMTEEDIHKTLAALQAEMAQRQKLAATKRNEMKGDAGTAKAGPDGNSAQGGQSDQSTTNKVATSVAGRYEKRIEVKKRAAEMRERMIEQGRQGAGRTPGAI
jgi:paraquat-inducible protein B